jgi:hypothetical protein
MDETMERALNGEQLYNIVKRNGNVHPDHRAITKEEAEKLVAKGQQRGWGWTMQEVNMDNWLLWNCWARGIMPCRG